MLQSEFEERVKMHVTCEEYLHINEVYNNSEVDKDEFCAMWVRMNRTRVKRAIANRKKAAELMALKGKIWAIYDKVKKIPYSEDLNWAVERLSARDITTLSKAGIRVESYMIGSFRSQLFNYLHA